MTYAERLARATEERRRHNADPKTRHGYVVCTERCTPGPDGHRPEAALPVVRLRRLPWWARLLRALARLVGGE